jgi:amino acid transporter
MSGVDPADDAATLRAMGYAQELARRMGGFSNFAMSLSIICILAGGVTSFHLGLCSVGGASIGLGWPLACGFSLVVAATMAQVASAYPTAGGLYHWAAILGGRGWGWATAWFNLAGLVAVLAAIDVGTYRFAVDALGLPLGTGPAAQALGVGLIAASQAAINHVGIRAVTRMTDLSGYLILIVTAAIVAGLLAFAPAWGASRLVSFANYSGPSGADVWPRTESVALLFALGLLLPAYTITGFDASAHAAEETLDASRNVPRGIVRSVLVSGVAGWVLLAAVVIAIPSLDEAATQGEAAFRWTLGRVLPGPLATALLAGIVAAQYLCGLATVTSASRMAYAFARDRGLPFSKAVRRVSPRHRTPAVAIWAVTIAAVLFTVHTPVYATITAVCTILLYISYVVPTALGLVAYERTWTAMGPWQLGPWYRPMAAVSALGCTALVAIGVQPPNERAMLVVGGLAIALIVAWFGLERRRFPGPPLPETMGEASTRAVRNSVCVEEAYDG